MKKIALLLALVMIITAIGIPAMAETAETVKPFTVNIIKVEADDKQVALEARVKQLITVDGLQFKDLNGNGELDVYEDWRQDVDARVEDLLSQMTLDEQIATLMNNTTGGTFTSLFPYTDEWMWSNEERITVDGTGYTPMYHSIVTDHVTTYLLNGNGTAEEQINETNSIQEIAESARLGIPVVLNCDRSYQTFAGMVDMPKYAFGTAHDTELLYSLASQYAKEERALGYHVPFQPQGAEIGAFYGEEVNNIAKMIAVEVAAKDDSGLTSCAKHFISNSNHNSNYAVSKSDANLLESWMVGWKAAIGAGTQWIMVNNAEGMTPGVIIPFDSVTIGYLRNTLGYDGIVVTDWPLFVTSPTATGITAEGKDLSAMTPGELYTQMLEAGVDLFGGYIVMGGTDTTIMDAANTNFATGNGGPSFVLTNWPDVIKAEVEAGKCDIELVYRSCRRVLKNKFELGLFENPYSDLQNALEIFASDAYKQEQFALESIDDIYAARKTSTNELEERLQTESAVLLKNDNNILPLSKDAKVYVAGSSDSTTALDAAAIAAYATVVSSIEEADVVVARVTSLDDNTELIIDDANEAGKPVVLAIEGSNGEEEVTSFVAENCAAILYQVYRTTPDHGSSMGSFFAYTLPRVMADMIFGERQPEGSLVFEIARDAIGNALDWGELQLDTKTRLYMAATVRRNPTAQLPNNLGDVLFPNDFGMRYGENADISLNTLAVPQSAAKQVTNSAWGSSVSYVVENTVQKSGEAFEIDFIAENKGADGSVTVEVYDGEKLIAHKFVSVEGGSFCVVPMDIVLEGAGEHTIRIGDMTAVIVVE